MDPVYPNPDFPNDNMNSMDLDMELDPSDLKTSPQSTSTPSSSSTTSHKPPLSSLEILSPHLSSNLHPDPILPKTKSALFVERLQTHCIAVLNSRDWTSPEFEIHVVPNFTAYMEYAREPYVTTREQFIDRYKKLCADNPTYRFEVVDMNASVDEAKGAALCWFRLRILGCPEGVEREGTYVNMWKKSKGTWVCYRQNGIRGMQVG